MDAGTYLYNGEPPWDNGLARTSVHNTVTIGGIDQMTRGGRFLWLDWAQGTVRPRETTADESAEWIQGEHDGYRSMGCRHRRCLVRLGEDAWVVVDEVTGSVHPVRLHWLLGDFPVSVDETDARISAQTSVGNLAIQLWCNRESTISVVRGGEVLHWEGRAEPVDEKRGWWAPYYGDKQPAVSVALNTAGAGARRFVTVMGLGDGAEAAIEPGFVRVRSQDGWWRSRWRA